MSANDVDDLFDGSSVVATPAVARFAGISESQARALASEIGVSRVGVGYAWDEDDVEELLELLDAEADDTDSDAEEDSDPDADSDEDGDGESDDEDPDTDSGEEDE